MKEDLFHSLLKTLMKLFQVRQALASTRLNYIMNKLLKISTKNHLNHVRILQGLFFQIVLKFILKVVTKLMENLLMRVCQAHQIKSLHLLLDQKLLFAIYVDASMAQHQSTFIWNLANKNGNSKKKRSPWLNADRFLKLQNNSMM
jgi:hypothetical protein